MSVFTDTGAGHGGRLLGARLRAGRLHPASGFRIILDRGVMFYLVAADIVVLVHFLWIVFLIFGAFIGRKYKWVKIVHIVGVMFALLIQIFGLYCPLTYIETWLRRMHDPFQSYTGSYIIHYVERIVYIGLSPNVILIMTIFLASVSAWLYLCQPGKHGPDSKLANKP